MNDLNQRLATLADEMADTDYTALRARVQGTARRLGRRRAAAHSAVALVVVGVTTVGGLQLLSPPPGPPPGNSATVAPVTPPASGGPTPSVTATPSTATSASADTPPGAVEHVPGRLVYLRVGAEIEVVTVVNGKVRTTSFGARKLGDQVATVSPDGSKVALVRPAKDLSEYPGDLVIVEPGGVRAVVARQVTWGDGNEPVWMPDSRRLLIAVNKMNGDTSTSQSYGYLDTVTGRYDELSRDPFPKYLIWSADGGYRAHADGNTIVVARADGSGSRRFSVADQPECERQCPYAVQAVSNDGRYVATTQADNGPTRIAGARIVLDTMTGGRISLPDTLGQVTGIFFRADNSLVVQTSNQLHLVSRDGRLTASVDRPEQTNSADLWRYVDQ
ncbi:hypothetical protein [Plantactinospora sp. B24E8]|uniref:hypothetical protein n=1 Tax=Plantactinospora sp. B24E8 TaxID=3153567 RepID=UPI00325E5409